MDPLLGAIADDFTGATDLAGMLVKHGMRTVQMFGVPRTPPPASADAIVVALKTTRRRRATPSKLLWGRFDGCAMPVAVNSFSSIAPRSIRAIGATSDRSPRR